MKRNIELNKSELKARSDEYRASNSSNKRKIIPAKLDVGCCFRKVEGYWGTDIYKFIGVDQIFDHNKYPWPLPDNHFDEVRLWHIMQYLPDTDSTMKELWRVCKNKAKIIIGVPYFMSTMAFGDRNKSFFNENTFKAFTDDSWYHEQIETYTNNARFKIIYQELRTTGKWRKFIPFKGFFRYFFWNIIDEMEIHLVVIKNKPKNI